MRQFQKSQCDLLFQVTFGNNEEPDTVYRFALKTSRNASEQEEEEEEEIDDELEEDETPTPSKTFTYQHVNVVYFDDSTRERWRRHLGYVLNKLEVSGYVFLGTDFVMHSYCAFDPSFRHWRRTWKTGTTQQTS